VFAPVTTTLMPDVCTGQASRTEETSLSYVEIRKHENTIDEKVNSGDSSITVSIYNNDVISGDFLVVATFTPIVNIDLSLMNKLTRGTVNLDYKLLREEKRSGTAFIPSQSTRDIAIRFDNPLYQVSKYEIISPKKSVTVTEKIDFPCQKQVYITYFQKIAERN
jgi:hypothetical protein